MSEPPHYLKAELDALIRNEPSTWQFIQEGSLDGIWYWDLEHPDNEWMSPEMWRLFGVDPATKTHNPAEWQDLIFPEDLEIALQNFHKHCEDPAHPYDQIVRYKHADGSTIWVRCRGVAIRDAQGTPIRMLGAHNDITAVKRAEQETRDALRDAELANKELWSFAYSISHDLMSPANKVSLLLSEFQNTVNGGLSEESRELFDVARETLDHMRQMVEDLLAYTHAVDSKIEDRAIPLDALVAEIEREQRDLLRSTGARIMASDLPTLRGSALQIKLLLQNLITNAIKFRKPGVAPVVRIAGLPPGAGGAAGFQVSDNGIGIDAKHHDRIFEIFTRLHRAEEIEGSGLGLTLCRKVARNHGGDISLVSEEGAGATFTVTFGERTRWD